MWVSPTDTFTNLYPFPKGLFSTLMSIIYFPLFFTIFFKNICPIFEPLHYLRLPHPNVFGSLYHIQYLLFCEKPFVVILKHIHKIFIYKVHIPRDISLLSPTIIRCWVEHHITMWHHRNIICG